MIDHWCPHSWSTANEHGEQDCVTCGLDKPHPGRKCPYCQKAPLGISLKRRGNGENTFFMACRCGSTGGIAEDMATAFTKWNDWATFMNDPVLLDCPFCGESDVELSTADRADPDRALSWVDCNDCAASGSAFLDKSKAVEAWNDVAKMAIDSAKEARYRAIEASDV